MACFERASPALKDILLRIYRAEKPVEIDHHLYEFGSVQYHIQSSASDPHHTYLSISTPLLSQGSLLSHGLSQYTIEMVKGVNADAVDIVEPAKVGYQLTLRLNFDKIPRGKDSVKVITQISAAQAVILSSQLKEMLQNVNSQVSFQGMHKPIKLVYHPREPFFVIRQPQKILAVFPMRFKENSDVIIATAFFQELMDVGSSKEWAKAPPCIWSPIPPPELRGELFEDLSTNGGFISFEISSRHVEGKRLDKTLWSLLNFYAYVKYHVKCTRGFIQRRMRKRLESLVQCQSSNCPNSQKIIRADKKVTVIVYVTCRYCKRQAQRQKNHLQKIKIQDVII
ncbi:Actin-related protein 2/3 complex subunit 2B [Morella rubra]|uniref:Arp2/3 complex 34 kDa subunit n=1 Tax=Morella rubra TaxID=262757 RepID=A0A6A1W259_9ROSI|nr:Actin-related protein 2/3 complex subunit 2B [Morella rubra]KAB1219329.1 Actin-related protein 2/3 complex subunit 2B [Morella rubra]